MKAVPTSLLLVLVSVFIASATDDLVIGRLTLVETSETVPYAYWYYVPESALTSNIVGLVWHATPGDSEPDDPVFWAKFDLGTFLACNDGISSPRVNLPEKHGLVLFSIAVPEPLPTFYDQHTGMPLGTPAALTSLQPFQSFDVDELFLDPDLKALESIEDLKRRLTEAGIVFDPRLLLTGVYRGAESAHRFTLLHPEEVLAVAPVCGNWYTMPMETLDDEPLPWPLGLADFEDLGRDPFDQQAFAQIPYYVTVSTREIVWYSEMTPEEQGIEMAVLERYSDHFGAIPPERGESFAAAWMDAGYPFELMWSEGGHGWIDPVRVRVFEFFSSLVDNAQ